MIAIADDIVPKGFTMYLDSAKGNWNGYLPAESDNIKLTILEDSKD